MDANSIVAHMKKIEEKRQSVTTTGQSNGGLYYSITEGTHIVRFVGNFTQRKVHWINNGVRNKLRLYNDSLFSNKKIPINVNCLNWNIEGEERKDNGCVICKLNKIAKNLLYNHKDSLSKDEITKFENLRSKTNDSTLYNWNIIPRKPDVQGYKIIGVSSDLFKDLLDIHNNYPKIFASDDFGVDIKIVRSNDAGKTSYSASIVLKDGMTVQVTPLTEDEKKWKLINLIEVCGKQTDQQLLLDNLESEWKDLLTSFEDGAKTEEKGGKSPF